MTRNDILATYKNYLNANHLTWSITSNNFLSTKSSSDLTYQSNLITIKKLVLKIQRAPKNALSSSRVSVDKLIFIPTRISRPIFIFCFTASAIKLIFINYFTILSSCYLHLFDFYFLLFRFESKISIYSLAIEHKRLRRVASVWNGWSDGNREWGIRHTEATILVGEIYSLWLESLATSFAIGNYYQRLLSMNIHADKNEINIKRRAISALRLLKV